MRQDQVCLAVLLALSTAACDDFRPGGHQAASQPAKAVSAADTTVTPTLAPASQAPVGQSIETAALTASPGTAAPQTPDTAAPSAAADTAGPSASPEAAGPASASESPANPPPLLSNGLSYGIVRAETLLDRAHFSPGVIDGRPGENLTRAVEAFRAANGLGAGGALDQATLDALEKTSPGPVTQDYTIPSSGTCRTSSSSSRSWTMSDITTSSRNWPSGST